MIVSLPCQHVRPQRAPGYNTHSVVDMQAGMQHPSLDGYEEVGVLGRG